MYISVDVLLFWFASMEHERHDKVVLGSGARYAATIKYIGRDSYEESLFLKQIYNFLYYGSCFGSGSFFFSIYFRWVRL